MKFGLFIKDRHFYKTVAVICVPIILQQVINIGVNLTDTVMLGSFGEAQLSAASLANQYFFIFAIFCMGLGGGAAVLTAQFWGMQDIQSIKKVTSLMLKLCAAVAFTFAVLTRLFPEAIMRLYTNEQAVITEGVKYLKLMSLVFMFHGLTQVTVIVVRTAGIVRLSLVAACVSFVLHIGFNWIFIFGNLGAPRLEIRGAALGTLLSRVIEFSIVYGYLLIAERKKLHFKFKDFFMSSSGMFKNFIRLASPVIVSDLGLAVGNNVVAAILGRLGAGMVAANAITTVTVQISTVIIMGMSSASSIMIGNAVGRREYETARLQGITFTALSFIVGVFASFVIWLINPLIIGFYNIQPETYAIAKQLMNAVAFIVIFQASSSVLTKGVLRGGGDTKFLMLADVLFLWIASIPLGLLSAFVFKLSAGLIYICLKFDMVIKSIWCLWRLKGGKWIRTVETEKTEPVPAEA